MIHVPSEFVLHTQTGVSEKQRRNWIMTVATGQSMLSTFARRRSVGDDSSSGRGHK